MPRRRNPGRRRPCLRRARHIGSPRLNRRPGGTRVVRPLVVTGARPQPVVLIRRRGAGACVLVGRGGARVGILVGRGGTGPPVLIGRGGAGAAVLVGRGGARAAVLIGRGGAGPAALVGRRGARAPVLMGRGRAGPPVLIRRGGAGLAALVGRRRARAGVLIRRIRPRRGRMLRVRPRSPRIPIALGPAPVRCVPRRRLLRGVRRRRTRIGLLRPPVPIGRRGAGPGRRQRTPRSPVPRGRRGLRRGVHVIAVRPRRPPVPVRRLPGSRIGMTTRLAVPLGRLRAPPVPLRRRTRTPVGPARRLGRRHPRPVIASESILQIRLGIPERRPLVIRRLARRSSLRQPLGHRHRTVPGRLFPARASALRIRRALGVRRWIGPGRRPSRRRTHRGAPEAAIVISIQRAAVRRMALRRTRRLVDGSVHRPAAAHVARIPLAGQRLPFPGDLVDPAGFVVPPV